MVTAGAPRSLAAGLLSSRSLSAGLVLAALVLGALCGCSRQAPAYAPPAQFVMPAGADPLTEVRFLRMDDASVTYSLMGGILDAGHGQGYKWTTDCARFEFRVRDLSASDLVMKYAVHTDTILQTGPIRITIAIGGRVFDSFIKSVPDDYLYRRPAAGVEVKPDQPFEVSVTINPPYIAKGDGQKLGILLGSIGFVPHGAAPPSLAGGHS